jgi:3-carboxy-cis,cis-muconate cycloisomerase
MKPSSSTHERPRMTLLESLGSTEALAEIFSDAAIVAAMLRFEVAIARAEAHAGVIPAAAADAIAAAAAETDAVDAAAIARAARESGTIVIPLVSLLRERVRAAAPAAEAFVHWGATSQDVSDTALVLCLARSRAILDADHQRIAIALRQHSDAHAATVMLARTLLQPATPTTFGLKAAEWFGAVARSGAALSAAFNDALVLQFGGASGTLAMLGAQGPAVAIEIARALGLADPGAPWHAQRERLAALMASCGVYTGTLGKIARDLSLLMQDEVAEAAVPAGGSSTMPHKRNAAGCAIVLAAAARVPGLVSAFLSGMPQEHERGIGGLHAEAPTVAAAVQATGSAMAAMADMLEHLSIDRDRMRANLTATRGVVFAERAMLLLAPAIGRDKASRAITAALDAVRRDGVTFDAALAADRAVQAAIAPGDLASLTAPESYLGAAEPFRRRLLGS